MKHETPSHVSRTGADFGQRRNCPTAKSGIRSFVRHVTIWPALGPIRIYQRVLSPALPMVFGSACGCRFHPTCSCYASDALRVHGLLVGGLLAAWRLLRCMPWHPGGEDPVPPSGLVRRICHRVPPRSVTA